MHGIRAQYPESTHCMRKVCAIRGQARGDVPPLSLFPFSALFCQVRCGYAATRGKLKLGWTIVTIDHTYSSAGTMPGVHDIRWYRRKTRNLIVQRTLSSLLSPLPFLEFGDLRFNPRRSRLDLPGLFEGLDG